MAPVAGADAVTTIRRILATLPDEYPPAAHAELQFISELDLRGSIRADVGAAHRALGGGEWKAATILAGSAIEALLHARLSQFDPMQRAAAPRAPTSKGVKKDLDDFVLYDCIVVAEDLKLINGATATAALLAKDYRNLIHPGRAARLSQQVGQVLVSGVIDFRKSDFIGHGGGH
jgi:hypothetical protein